jgi:hypothetical protein
MTLKSNLNMDYNKYDFKDSIDQYIYLSKKGLARETVEEISRLKDKSCRKAAKELGRRSRVC